MLNKILHNKFVDKIRYCRFFRRYPTVKEMAKYSLVGNIANLSDLGLYIILTRLSDFWLVHYLSANILTMLLASIFRFIMHKKWTFRNDSHRVRIQYIKFVISLLASMFLNLFIIYAAVEWLHINDIISKILSMAITTLVVYFMTKKWVFSDGKNHSI